MENTTVLGTCFIILAAIAGLFVAISWGTAEQATKILAVLGSIISGGTLGLVYNALRYNRGDVR